MMIKNAFCLCAVVLLIAVAVDSTPQQVSLPQAVTKLATGNTTAPTKSAPTTSKPQVQSTGKHAPTTNNTIGTMPAAGTSPTKTPTPASGPAPTPNTSDQTSGSSESSTLPPDDTDVDDSEEHKKKLSAAIAQLLKDPSSKIDPDLMDEINFKAAQQAKAQGQSGLPPTEDPEINAQNVEEMRGMIDKLTQQGTQPGQEGVDAGTQTLLKQFKEILNSDALKQAIANGSIIPPEMAECEKKVRASYAGKITFPGFGVPAKIPYYSGCIDYCIAEHPNVKALKPDGSFDVAAYVAFLKKSKLADDKTDQKAQECDTMAPADLAKIAAIDPTSPFVPSQYTQDQCTKFSAKMYCIINEATPQGQQPLGGQTPPGTPTGQAGDTPAAPVPTTTPAAPVPAPTTTPPSPGAATPTPAPSQTPPQQPKQG